MNTRNISNIFHNAIQLYVINIYIIFPINHSIYSCFNRLRIHLRQFRVYRHPPTCQSEVDMSSFLGFTRDRARVKHEHGSLQLSGYRSGSTRVYTYVRYT